MEKVDALSQCPDFEKGEKDNEDVILIEPHHLQQMSMEIEDKGVKLLEGIHGEKEVERVVKQKLLLKEKEWREEDGLILWQNHIYILPNRKLRKEVIHMHHSMFCGGHPGTVLCLPHSDTHDPIFGINK